MTGTRRAAPSPWAEGGMIFAATMMVMIGLYQVFMGIAAIAKDEFFVKAPNYYYNVDTTTWGWVHLCLGALVALTGFFLFTGATWARWIGIFLVTLQAISNFFFVPYYPLWSLLLIALDVFVIWALATMGRAGSPMAMDSGAAAGGAAYGGNQRWAATNPAGYGAGAEVTSRKVPDTPAAAGAEAREAGERSMPSSGSGTGGSGQSWTGTGDDRG